MADMQPTPGTPRSRVRWFIPAAVALVLAVGIGWAFQLWTLFVDHRVTEAMPGLPTTARTSAAPGASSSAGSAAPGVVSAQPGPDWSCDGLPQAGPPAGPDVDLDAIVTVGTWSQRYAVSYGAAALQR